MSPFEFFFSFYGLLLGFSVAELVGGFARLLHRRREIRFGYLTPLLAIFVVTDIATFWNQAWAFFRNAPFNLALLFLGLVVASVFYVAATLVFPRDIEDGAELDTHFWTNRRIVMLCVLAANWLVAGVIITMTALTGEMAQLNFGVEFWFGFSFFSTACLLAAFAPWRRVVLAVLALLIAYQAYAVVRAGIALVSRGGWSISGEAAN